MGVRRGGGVDRTLARIAAANNRVITWRAVQAAGLSHRAVEHRVAIGRLHRRHDGVYLLEPAEVAGRVTLLTAAVAACEPNAVLSHASAAELWGLLQPRPGDIDVTVIGRNPGERPGVRRHRSRTFEPRDIGHRRGIPVTSPARTILDSARDPDLEEMVGAAIAKGLLRTQQIEQAVKRCPGGRGARRLRALLDQDGGARRTRSWAERRLLSLIRAAGLPVPLTNQMLLGFQVDAVWPEHRLVVEVDGRAFHSDRHSFENDRARDAALLAAGYRVLRFTATQLAEQPMMVIGQLAATLALASSTNARTSAA